MPAKVARTQIDRAQDEIGRPAGKLMFLHKFAFFKFNTQQNYVSFISVMKIVYLNYFLSRI